MSQGPINQDAASQQLPKYKKENGQNKEGTFTARRPDGIPYASLTSALTCGVHGPPLLQDTDCISLLQNYVRQNKPPRIVHAKGHGAYGRFKLTNMDMAKYSKACIFQPSENNNQGVELLFRFSTPDTPGTPDHNRANFAMSLKFYTEEGNYDLLCLNLPIFILRHPANFSPSVLSGLPNPQTAGHAVDQTANWDFMNLSPDNLHLMIVKLSDRGLILSSRFTSYFPINTFKLVNEKGDHFFARFEFKSNQGNKYVTEGQATVFRKTDPDYMTRDMFNAIARSDFPSWTWLMQIMDKQEPAKFEAKYGWSPFDVTKLWPQADYPPVEIGVVTADRHVDNFSEEVESAFFNPGSLIPGIEAPLQDFMLHGRIFMYAQSQLYRIGKNKSMLPCNQPRNLKGPLATYYRQGLMNYGTGSLGQSPAYFPNNFGGPRSKIVNKNNEDQKEFSGVLDYYDYSNDSFDNYTFPRIYYEDILDAGEKDRLAENVANQIGQATKSVQKNVLKTMSKVSVELSRKIEQKLMAKQ